MTEHDPEYPVDDDELHPLGSCDECGVNLYENDNWYLVPGYGEVCGQCAWRLRMRGVE